MPILVGNLAVALTLRFTANPKIHAASVIAVWLLLIVFVSVFAMRLGAVAEAIKLGA